MATSFGTRSVLDFGAIEGTSNQLFAIGQQVVESLAQATKLMAAMQPDFQGASGSAAQTFYQQLKTTADTFTTEFADFALAIGKAGETLGEAERQVASKFAAR